MSRRPAIVGWSFALVIPLAMVLGFAFAHEPSLAISAIVAVGGGLWLVAHPRTGLLIALGLVPLARLTAFALPLSDLMILAAIATFTIHALSSREELGLLPAPRWLLPLLVAMLAFVVVSMLANGSASLAAVRRLVSLLGGFVILYLLARGAVDGRRAATSLAIGLVLSGVVGLAYLAVGHDGGYAGRLVGLFGDPNLAGFQLVVLGTAAVGWLQPGKVRAAVVVLLLVFLVATASRTSLLALVVVVGWVLGTRGDRLLPGLVIVAAVGVLVTVLPHELVTTGPFQQRVGSDALRERVLEATERSAWSAPLIGHGPTSGRVEVVGVRDVSLLPHNSYLAMVREAGVFYLVLWLTGLVAVFLMLVRVRKRNPCLEAALLGIFVVAIELGAVLVEVPTMIVVGLSLQWLALRDRGRAAGDEALPSPEVAAR